MSAESSTPSENTATWGSITPGQTEFFSENPPSGNLEFAVPLTAGTEMTDRVPVMVYRCLTDQSDTQSEVEKFVIDNGHFDYTLTPEKTFDVSFASNGTSMSVSHKREGSSHQMDENTRMHGMVVVKGHDNAGPSSVIRSRPDLQADAQVKGTLYLVTSKTNPALPHNATAGRESDCLSRGKHYWGFCWIC
ncbi:hypothetical protein I302_102914 [Kwoniella bestiolae CBS 10118]|uniref:Uncharacterized protein n=1 Tax=Kwoniella bestiolae CBS 10118 TaxID=1296100 RepID=A0AAJ8M6R5_9TREE